MKGNLDLNVLIYHLRVHWSPQVIEQQRGRGSNNSPLVPQTSQGILFSRVCAFTLYSPKNNILQQAKVFCFPCANLTASRTRKKIFVPCSHHT